LKEKEDIFYTCNENRNASEKEIFSLEIPNWR